MSYLVYYKIRGSVSNPPIYLFETPNPSLESFNFNKIKQYLVNLFRSILNYFKRVYRWIRDRVLKLFKHRQFKLNINGILRRKNIASKIIDTDRNKFKLVLEKYFKERVSVSSEDNNVLLTDYFSKYEQTYIDYFIDDSGKLFDIDKIINRVKNTIDSILGMVDDYPQGLKHGGHSIDFLSTTDLGGTVKRVDIISYTINKLSLLPEKELFKHIDDKLNIVEKVQSFYNKYEPILSLKLQQCEKELNVVDDEKSADILRLKITGLQYGIKLSLVPINIVYQYFNLMEYIVKEVLTNSYISIEYTSSDGLYHISTNPNLGHPNSILYPNISDSMRREFLPPRISFSPTLEGCVLGGFQHLYTEDGVDEGLLFKEFYLYRGIPDNGTRIIKPEIVNVSLKDYYNTNEVCVITPIRIEKIGRIKVCYKSKDNILSKDNIVKIVKEDSL